MAVINDFLLLETGFRLDLETIDPIDQGSLFLETTIATDTTSLRILQEPVDFVVTQQESGDLIKVPMDIARRIFNE